MAEYSGVQLAGQRFTGFFGESNTLVMLFVSVEQIGMHSTLPHLAGRFYVDMLGEISTFHETVECAGGA